MHGLLFSGQRALNELFPGFEQEPLRAGLDVRVERPGYDPFPHRDLGWSGYAASRPAIEHAVRRRVESRANTTLRQRCRVTEVLATPNGGAVTRVRCENGHGVSETITADLVVDASGRGALTIALLQSIGRPQLASMPHASSPSRTTLQPTGRALCPSARRPRTAAAA